MPMKGRFLSIVVLLLVVSVAAAAFVYVLNYAFFRSYGLPLMGKRIGLIEIEGTILSAEPVVGEIKDFRTDDSIEAIVLRVDSPGGGVAASQEIYQELVRAREDGKLVVASMGGVAASGGYYVASGADLIVANEGTITGSIGVIATFPSLGGLFEKVGVDYEVVKSGEYKDMGSFARKLTEAERRLLQETMDDVLDQFIEVVVGNRPLEREEVEALADGRILSGRQALALGLVDELGGLERAIEVAAERVGITGRPRVVRPVRRRPFSLRDFVGVAARDLGVRPGFGPELQYLMCW